MYAQKTKPNEMNSTLGKILVLEPRLRNAGAVAGILLIPARSAGHFQSPIARVGHDISRKDSVAAKSKPIKLS
jgi:hypothetical protein